MRRRLFVFLFRRALVATILLCLGCAAQSVAPELNQRVERQIRSTFTLPATVKVTVLARKPSPDFPNYDTLTVELSQGETKRPLEMLISRDNNTLVRVTKMDLSKDPYAEIMKKIDVSGRPVLGNPAAKVTIVNYDDFQCPFCSRMHDMLMQDVAKKYGGQVRIIYKDFPLIEIHPWSIHAAVNANCLAAQNADAYWDFATFAHANQKEITGSSRPLADQMIALDRGTTEIAQKRNLQLVPLQSCMKAQQDAAVRASMNEASGLGITATPTMFINGERVEGIMPPNDLHAVIDRALRDADPSASATAAKK